MTKGQAPGSKPAATVIPIASHLRQDSALERMYREKKAALTTFLRFRLGTHADAEDVAQAAFMQLWSRRDALRPDNLSALLFVTARNLATDIMRSRRRTAAVQVEASEEWPERRDAADMTPSPERTLIARRDLRLIQDMILDLPPKCREAFVAYRINNQEYAEIAQDMGVSESMVRKYVRRATVYCVARFSEAEAWE